MTSAPTTSDTIPPHSSTAPARSTAAAPEGVQLKPGGQGPAIKAPDPEDLFLSPRVMDAGAFSRYADALKSIIAQATAQGRTLEDFGADAEELIRRAADSETTLDTRLQAGMRLLKLLDERAEKAQRAIDQISGATPDADALEARLARSIDETVERAVSRVEARAREAEAPADPAAARADEAARRLEDAESRLAGAAGRADTTAGSLETMAQRAGDEIDARIAHALTTCEDRASTLDETIVAFDDRIASIKDAADEALRALGLDPGAPRLEDSPLAAIRSLVERGETHIAGADRLFRQLEDLRAQAEGVKAEFGSWLVDSATKLDELESRREVLEGPIAAAASVIEGCTPEIEARIERAQRSIDELGAHAQSLQAVVHDAATTARTTEDDLSNQAAQMQALLDGSINRLTERVEQAGQWLGSLIARARESGQRLGYDPDIPVQPHPAPAPESAPVQTQAPRAAAPDAVPQRLPIDSISFDGADQVFEHADDDHEAGASGAD